MKLVFVVWIALTLLTVGWYELHDPVYRQSGLDSMGVASVALHHLVAFGTAEFFALLLIPPILLWCAGAAILVVARWARE
jgi:hypothetical protein